WSVDLFVVSDRDFHGTHGYTFRCTRPSRLPAHRTSGPPGRGCKGLLLFASEEEAQEAFAAMQVERSRLVDLLPSCADPQANARRRGGGGRGVMELGLHPLDPRSYRL